MKALGLFSFGTVLAFAVPAPVAHADVLIYGADNDGFREDVLASVEGAGVELGAVDLVDARSVLLTPELAAEYDAILTWGNQNYEDPVALGDVLADYCDAGGGVVVSAMATADSYYRGIRGRFDEEAYMATNRTEDAEDDALTMLVSAPEHRIFDDVVSFSGGSRSIRSGDLQPSVGADVLATWSSGELLVAAKTPACRSVVLNFFPISSDSNYGGTWDAETDGDLLLANALWWSMGATCGDGYAEEDEACDDGNDDETDDCLACELAACGDGAVQTGVEACDDGNDDDDDGCRNDCTLPPPATTTSGGAETGDAPPDDDAGEDGSSGFDGDGGDPSAGESAATSATTGEETGGGVPEQSGDASEGCGCRSGGPRGAVWFGLLAGLIGVRTRRRAAAGRPGSRPGSSASRGAAR